MTPIEALYGRKYRSLVCWDDLTGSVVLTPQSIEDMIEQGKIIRIKMKAAQDRQKSYADLHRRDIEFQKGKLSTRYIGPFEVLERVGEVAYKLALPATLERVHNVFHVSQLRKYMSDATHVLDVEEVESDKPLAYEDVALQILDHKV
ncbi:hypothetical protein vseg_007911 [Gypsophila vaccaria]